MDIATIEMEISARESQAVVTQNEISILKQAKALLLKKSASQHKKIDWKDVQRKLNRRLNIGGGPFIILDSLASSILFADKNNRITTPHILRQLKTNTYFDSADWNYQNVYQALRRICRLAGIEWESRFAGFHA